jgi:hypothetical protein
MDDDIDVIATDSGIVGELDTMCSFEEISLRTETRQVDKFEVSREYLKKYQRSSADKKYLPSEIRTIGACWKSVEYLLDEILDFDVNPKQKFSEPCYTANYFDIYSFMRDRLRAVRVDLHVQNASCNPVFISVHEYCLRFELLSLYLLWGREFGGSSDRKFDLHMTLTALSQTIDPLTNAYAKRRTMDPSEIEVEAEITRYILLLSLTSRGGSKQFKAHFLKQPEAIKSHPLVMEAFDICCEFYAGMNQAILNRIEGMDFLSTCALLPVLNLVRTRAVWRIVRTNRPFFLRTALVANKPPMPPPRPEKLNLDLSLLKNLGFVDFSECAEFLSFLGLDTKSVKGVCLLPPRQLSKNPIKWWMSTRDWRMRSGDDREFPDFEWDTELTHSFESRIGTDLGDEQLPDRSEYPQRIQGVLVKQYLALCKQKSRKMIVTGSAVPIGKSEVKNLVSYPTFAPIEFKPTQDVSRVTNPFSSVPIPTPPPKPERPIVPIQPLSSMISTTRASPKKIFEDHPKRPRDIVSPTPPSPSEPIVIRPKVEVVPILPIPSVPQLQSSFDLLATEFDTLKISSFPSLPAIHQKPAASVISVHARLVEADLAQSAAHMRELDMSERRTKFVALKTLIAWRQVVNDSNRWKRLIAADSPVRL